MSDLTQKTITRLDQLAAISESADGITRRFLTPEMDAAGTQLANWFEAAGLQTTIDPLGNIIGHRPADTTNADVPTLACGSHYDTVINAGKYDGPLGILTCLAAIESLAQRDIKLDFNIDLLGFADEEGVRFCTTFLGSKSLCGMLDKEVLTATDGDDICLRDVINERGVDCEKLPNYFAGKNLIGYFESHIEQGRILESENLPLGVVSTIAGQTRIRITVGGHADHAGNTPMDLRRDAIAGAAEIISVTEKIALENQPAVATVGKLIITPNVSNTIAESVVISIDLRTPDNDQKAAILQTLKNTAEKIATRRNLTADWDIQMETKAVNCDTHLTKLLIDSTTAAQPTPRALISGAGHDAVILAHLCPITMLFVRCRNGTSHNPEEYVEPTDIDATIVATATFFEKINHSIKNSEI